MEAETLAPEAKVDEALVAAVTASAAVVGADAAADAAVAADEGAGVVRPMANSRISATGGLRSLP